MSKKIVGENAIKKVMDLGIKLFPNIEITSTEVSSMWDELDDGPDYLSQWDYTLDDETNHVILNQFTDDKATDVIIYDTYKKNGKTYTPIKKLAGIMAHQTGLFYNKINIQSITFNSDIIYGNSTFTYSMFNGCKSLTSINGLEKLNTARVVDTQYMFYGCSALTEIKGIEHWDTSNVTNMSAMFSGCNSITSLDLSNWNISKVTNISTMFYKCSGLTSIDLSGWDTSKVTNMNGMFYKCTKLAEIKVSRSKFKLPDGVTAATLLADCACDDFTYVD